jgi:hypothetical protein
VNVTKEAVNMTASAIAPNPKPITRSDFSSAMLTSLWLGNVRDQ